MPKIKLGSMATMLDDFKAALLNEHEVRARRYVGGFIHVAKSNMLKTITPTQYGFRGARPRVNYKIQRHPGRGVSIKINTLVAEGNSNDPHRIWHYINDGQDYTTTKAKSILVGNNQPRTTPNSYAWKAPNTNWRWRRLEAGKRIYVPPRNWYTLIGKDTQNTMKQMEGFKDWDIDHEVKR